MKTVTIQGQSVPALGFGTWQLDGAECQHAVEHALDIGYRHIDTAQAYKNEEKVGQALANSPVDREDIFLTTKLWRENLEQDDVRQTAENSLRRLQTDHVDLLLVHWPNSDVPMAETFDAMKELVAEEKVHHIGVSNFTTSQVQDAMRHAPLFCNQLEYHPYLSQDELLEQARKYDYLLTAYSPIARGDVMEDDVLQDIADQHGKEPAQIALRWLIEQDHVAAIPKSADAEHREANFQIFDFELSDGQTKRIDELKGDRRLIDPDFAPNWDG